MVSPELIRRYPFFSGLNKDQILILTKAAGELIVDIGHYFFHDGDELDRFYLVLEGTVAIVCQIPDRDVEQKISDQLIGTIQTKDVVVTTVGSGEMFGWSGLIPPHQATAGAKSLTNCRVITFDCKKVMEAFEEDCRFGYLMTQKTAQVIRERLRDLRIETLTYPAE